MPLTFQYEYDAQKKGLLSSISGDGHTQEFTYDDHCRIQRTTETYPGLDEIYSKDYGFDKFGRQNLETFSDYGVTIENKYHEESGALIEVGTNINGTFTSAWKATKDDVMGNITEWNTGNNTIPVTKDVEIESGNIREIDYGYGSGSLYNIEYDYYADRNFKMRKHSFGSTTQTEYYAFDKMKQLIYSGPSLTTAEHVNWDESEFTDTASQTIRYDDFGQKTYIEGVCAPGTVIDYDADGHIANPDALTTNNPLFRKQQFIRYNSRNRVECFQLDDDSLKFEYRPDTTKWRTKYYEDGALKYTKYHFGNHEKFVYPNGTTKNLFYIFGGKELTGLYIKENSTGQMGYVISDHLGSVWALANDQGGFIEQYAYDPWGRRMVPTDWSTPDTTRTEFITDRGFTLHEHYDHMQIINMNARPYDPLLGVFTGVDPLADKYPGWGSYVYCLNNPLIYWDPNGEDVWELDEIGELVWKEESENDVVNKVNEDGEVEASIEFDGKVIEETEEVLDLVNPKGAEKDGSGIGVKVNDNGAAADLFKFCADNTSVEFGFIETKDNGSVVMTNQHKSKVAVRRTAEAMDKSSTTILEINHNHPGGGPPSKADKGGAAGFTKSQGQTIKYNVYTSTNGGTIVPYNGQGLIPNYNTPATPYSKTWNTYRGQK